MNGWLTLQRGRLRHWWYPIRFQLAQQPGLYGTAIRIYDWYSTRDVEMAQAKAINPHLHKPKLQRYKFKIGQTIQITKSKRVGIVLYRWRNQWGQILYQCGMGGSKWLALLNEWEVSASKYKMFSKVKIEEVEYESLADGTWTWRTLPTHYRPRSSVDHTLRRAWKAY